MISDRSDGYFGIFLVRAKVNALECTTSYKMSAKIKVLLGFVTLTALVGCVSPYAAQISSLDKDYKAGKINATDYYTLRQSIAYQDAQWHEASNDKFGKALTAGLMGGAAGVQAVQQQRREDAAINAYNYRTQVLAQPQTYNVNENINATVNANINQNVNGTMYLKGH
jgi:hypothetical protein